VSAGGRLFSVQVPDWGQDHLSAEAIAAYVDGELDERPYERATRHLAACPECAAQVVAQGQARSALRSARCPRLSSSLMSTLRSIPQDAELPGPPNGLAMGPDGELVARLRPEPPPAADPAPPAGLAEAPPKARRSRIGAGAAISGLALGALAIGAAIIAGDTPAPSGFSDPPSIDAHLQLPGAP
jgi:putative zinc finger protein